MNRTDEIKALLKHLLGNISDALDDNQYVSDFNRILQSSKDIVLISKQIGIYIDELEEIQEKINKQDY